MPKVPTFEQLVNLEPRLAALLAEARAYRRDRRPDFCGNAAWYGYAGYPGLKPRLLRLVGFERPERHTVLSTAAAYDVAYDTVLAALPDCRGNCACSGEPPDEAADESPGS